MESRPLSEGNALQRRYAQWAGRHYARMAPELREQAELIDRFLYSRRGLGFWFGLLAATVGSTVGLRHAGMDWVPATALSLVVWLALPLAGLAAWLQPALFSAEQIRKKMPKVLLLTFAGMLWGFVVGHVVRHKGFELDRFLSTLGGGLKLLVPAGLGAAFAMMALMWGLAQVRRQVLERALERERLGRERDLAARQAAEAQLKLLQAQIQPHFIFNTLAALQHWVDSSDPRAGPLLRSLTAFLRGSTELLGQGQVTLGAEAETTRQYLQIMQARLGDRLQFELQVAPDCADTVLPPGLLLTLVENAIEHGISPALAGGRVQVRAAHEDGVLVLRVRDDGQGLAPGWQDGTGLANCRERLRHHGDGRGTLVLRPLQPGTEAVLTLPEPTR